MMSRRRWISAARLAIGCWLLSGCGRDHRLANVSPEQRLHVARAAETSGEPGLARSLYTIAAAAAPNDRDIQLGAAEGLARVGAPVDAMAVLDGVLAQSPGDQEVRRSLGALQIVNGQAAEAARNLAQVVAARPDDDIARLDEGVALDMLHRHEEARRLYRAILARTPADVAAANNLAYSLLLTGDVAAAKAVLMPFQGKIDLPERVRMTMRMAERTLGPGQTTVPRPVAEPPGIEPFRPIPLNVR